MDFLEDGRKNCVPIAFEGRALYHSDPLKTTSFALLAHGSQPSPHVGTLALCPFRSRIPKSSRRCVKPVTLRHPCCSCSNPPSHTIGRAWCMESECQYVYNWEVA